MATASSSSVVLRMLRPTGNPTFLNTNSSESPLGSSAVLSMLPKSVSMMNAARRIPKSVFMLQAWKRPTRRRHFLLLSDEDFNNDGFSVDIDSGSDEDDVDDDDSQGVVVSDVVKSVRRKVGIQLDRYDVKEDDDALHLKLEFPGQTKEGVRVDFVKDIFIIRVPQKTWHISEVTGLPVDKYKVEETKAKMMKNGVLKLVVPKKKKDKERKDVSVVKVRC